MIDLSKYFAEMRKDLGIKAGSNTFSSGVESWTILSTLNDQDGDPLNLGDYLECAGIENPVAVTVILSPSPWIAGEMIVSYQEEEINTRESLRVFIFPIDRGGYLLVGMRVISRSGIMLSFSDSYGWYTPSLLSMKKDCAEELRDYLEF